MVYCDFIYRMGERDRHAVLLRFFEARSFAEVGAQLNLTENAARMRVDRALDKMKSLLTQRGLTSTSVTLAAVLSHQAALAAPAGLATTVASSALAGAAITTVLPSVLPLMITSKHLILGAALVAAIVGCLYEGSVILRQKQQIAGLVESVSTAQAHISALKLEREESRKLADQERANVTEKTATEAQVTIGPYSNKLDQLIERLKKSPEQAIPEMRLLDPDDWIAALVHQPLNTEDDYRKALAHLRWNAKQHFGEMMRSALDKYRKEFPGQMPDDMMHLAPYFDPPADGDMLQRYEVQKSPTMLNPSAAIRDRLASIIDDKYDYMIRVGADGGLGWGTTDQGISFRYATEEADLSYRAANNGAKAKDPAELAPYFTDPANGQKWIETLAKAKAMNANRGGSPLR